MPHHLQQLVGLLDLEMLDTDLYRGQSLDLGTGRAYGGQVIGQALVAAMRTVDTERQPHSLHAYFLRPGDISKPIIYRVRRDRDGRSFTARSVQAIQNGVPILSMMASFQVEEPGFDHQVRMPDVPPPEDISEERSAGWVLRHLVRREDDSRMLKNSLPLDVRVVPGQTPVDPNQPFPHYAMWLRAGEVLPDDPIVHRCVMAYASDLDVLTTSMLPHLNELNGRRLQVASIDHAIWFHRPARADEWLLYAVDSNRAVGARGLSRGMFFNRAGELVATTAQEGLIRPVEPRA